MREILLLFPESLEAITSSGPARDRKANADTDADAEDVAPSKRN